MTIELSSIKDDEELSLKPEGILLEILIGDAELPVIHSSAVEAELETSTDGDKLLLEPDGRETLALDTTETVSLSAGEMLDADVMEELLLRDSPLEDDRLIDSDDSKELDKSEDTDGDNVNPEVSDIMLDGEDDG